MSKLPETKKVKVDTYTTLELACLYQDIINEFTVRKGIMEKAQSMHDTAVSDIYHNIELNDFTNTDKIKEFNKLQATLGKRRMVKREQWTLKTVSKNISLFSDLAGINKAIGQTQSYLKVKDNESLYSKQGEFTRFYIEAKQAQNGGVER